MISKTNQRVTNESDLAERQAACREYLTLILQVSDLRTPTAIARKSGLSPSTINRFLNNENVTFSLDADTLRAIQHGTEVPFTPKIQRVYGLSSLDADAVLPATPEPLDPPNVRPAPEVRLDSARLRPEDIPVRGVVRGGSDGAFDLNMGEQPLEYVRRPVSLIGKGGVYALHVEGDSMAPKYEPGETILLWENRPPLIGRDIVYQLRPKVPGDNPPAYLKRLVKKTSTEIVVAQFNPAKQRTIKLADVISIHMVLTRDEMI